MKYIVEINEYVDNHINLVSEDIPVHTDYSEIFSSKKEAIDYIHNDIIESIDANETKTYDLTNHSGHNGEIRNEWDEVLVSYTLYELVPCKS